MKNIIQLIFCQI